MLVREQVSKQKPDFSKWTLRYHAFGRDFEFSWLARNMEVTPRFLNISVVHTVLTFAFSHILFVPFVLEILATTRLEELKV